MPSPCRDGATTFKSNLPVGGILLEALNALLGIDVPEALHDLEPSAPRLGDVHVHPHVVLAGSHLGRAARTFEDAGMIQRRDDPVLLQRARLVDRRLPQLQATVEARAGTPGRELRGARIERVIPLDELLAERVGDILVVVEAAVEPLDVSGRDEVEEILVEVGADDLPTPPREAGTRAVRRGTA